MRYLLPKLAFGEGCAQEVGSFEGLQSALWPDEGGCSLSFEGEAWRGRARVARAVVGRAVVVSVSATPCVEAVTKHDWAVFWLPLNGQIRVTACGTSVLLLGGKNALLVDGGDWSAECGLCSYVRILLPRDLVGSLNLAMPEVVGPVGASARLIELDPALMEELLCFLGFTFRLSERSHFVSFLNLEMVIVRFVSLLIEQAGRVDIDQGGVLDSVYDDRLQLIIDAILADLSAPLSLSDMELLSGLSRRSIQYMFKRKFGLSPIGWQLRERLSGAYSALKNFNDRRTVTQIAFDFGFASSSTFSVYFRRQFGVSPSEVRQ